MSNAEHIVRVASTPKPSLLATLRARAEVVCSGHSPRSRAVSAAGVAAVVAATLFLAVPSAASAADVYARTDSFGEPGSGNGQLALAAHSAPAVDLSSGDVYVTDTGNGRVEEFSSTGAFIRVFGSFTDPTFIAIDNSCAEQEPPLSGAECTAFDPSAGDVYVADLADNTVAKFDAEGNLITSWASAGRLSTGRELAGLAIDATGNLYVLGRNGAFQEAEAVNEFTQAGVAVPGEIRALYPARIGLAVDPRGNVFYDAGANGREGLIDDEIVNFDFGGGGTRTLIATLLGETGGLAVDPFTSDFLVVQNGYEAEGSYVNQYAFECGRLCTPLEQFGAEELSDPQGIAVGADHVVYVTNAGSSEVAVFTLQAVEPPTATIAAPTAVTATTAHFSGQVDPGPYSTTLWHFQCTPECPGLQGGKLKPDNTTHEVSAEATGLQPATEYQVALVAENKSGEPITAQPGPVRFTTKPAAPKVDATFVTEVGATGATLGAEVDPHGEATTAHFEYLSREQFIADGESFGAGTESTPESASVGADSTDHPTAARINGLQPATAYEYRVIAHNSLGTVPGPARAFTTTAVSCPNEQLRAEDSSTHLPDCRAYEMVSPLEKGGDNAQDSGFEGDPVEASPSGESLAYTSQATFAGATNFQIFNTYLASRGAGGWQNANLTAPISGPTPPALASLGIGFSADLSQTVTLIPFQQLAAANLPPEEATPAVYNLFIRHPDGSYALVTAAAPADPPPPDCGNCFQEQDLPAFAGANSGAGEAPAFSHVLFEVNESLLTTPRVHSAAGVDNLYESDMEEPAAGRVHPVGILPDGTVPASGSEPGAGISALVNELAYGGEPVSERAISADGSHVVFEADADGGKPDRAQNGITEVYDRVDGSSTIELSAPAAGAHPANPNAEPAQYWGASTDGSEVFFTSSAELTTESNTGSANQGNDLYRYDTATETLTDLSADPTDPDGAEVQGVIGASEDGSYVYFVAKGKLTSSPNPEGDQAGAGQPNLYLSHGGTTSFIATLSQADGDDWTAEPSQLSTAYLTPDGRHLAFLSVAPLTGYDNTDQGSGKPDSEAYEYSAEPAELACASCDPTGARPLGAAAFTDLRTPYYQPRILSDDGARLFFSSPDPLDPGSASGGLFEYEGGQDHLIAAGATYTGAHFIDASADGDNVFFLTSEQLSSADHDKLYDIYDARVDGGFPEPAPEPVCEEGGCQGPTSAPPPSTTPATQSFDGPGNLKQAGCRKDSVMKRGVCVTQKHHHAKKHHKPSHKRHAGHRRGGAK